jgi:hypothetical protein
MSSSPPPNNAASAATVIAMDGCNDASTDSHEMTNIAAAPTAGIHVTTPLTTPSEVSPLAIATSTPAATTTSYVGGLFKRWGGGGSNSATPTPTIAESSSTATLTPSTTAPAASSSSTARTLGAPPELNIVSFVLTLMGTFVALQLRVYTIRHSHNGTGGSLTQVLAGPTLLD